MAPAKIARLQVVRAQLEAIERQQRKRQAYLRGVTRARLLEKYLRLGAAFGAGFIACQIFHLLLL